MLRYPAKLERDGEGYVVTFRDIPEDITSGATKEAAWVMAEDALLTAMDFYIEDERVVPPPSGEDVARRSWSCPRACPPRSCF